MGGNGEIDLHPGGWRRRAVIALAIFSILLVIFHRPVLLAIIHRVALHYAAKENLKIEFRLEGSVFTNLTVRNLHAVPIGPSDVEAIDVDFARIDYGFFTLLRHGFSEAVQSVDLRLARIVMNPAKAALRPKPPNPNKALTLPDFFPQRVHLSDASITVRNQPHDFVAEHLNADLDPGKAGRLSVGKLQLVGGQTWLKLSAQTSYTNRNLILREIALSDNERIRSIDIDASQITARKLAINFDYAVEGGGTSGAITLRESKSSIDASVHLHAEKVPIETTNKYAALPEDWMRGQIDQSEVELTGLLNSPATWKGKISAQISNFQHKFAGGFEHGVFQIVAENGVATLQAGDITQDQNQFHLSGSSDLPRDIREIGRAPATLRVVATVPDLEQATAAMPQKLSGSAQLNGKIDIKDATLDGEFQVTAPSVGFQNGQLENLNGSIKIAKKMGQANSDKPWFSELKSEATLAATNVRFRDYAADSMEASLRGANDLVTFDRLLVKRKQNEFVATGAYRLPKNLQDVATQPAKIDLSFNAVELADYWRSNSPDKISGPLQAAGHISWDEGMANGRLWIYGADVRMRDLVFKQVNSQCEIWNNIVYLNDVSANLNEQDFVNASAVVDLRRPFHYRGRFRTNVVDLSKLQPLLRAFGNQNQLAGSLMMEWEGSGDAAKVNNSGKLKLSLEKGRYGNMQSLQANADATYSPVGLDIPNLFLRSDKMQFQIIAASKGDTLEISKIELDQAQAKYAGGYISIPLVWRKLGSSAAFPANGKVTAVFQSENLDIKKFFQDLGLKAPVSGLLNVKLDAAGTLGDLTARFDLHMRDLRNENARNLEPATFDLTAETHGQQLNVAGKFQQAKIQPVELTANLPFDIPKIASEGRLADETPVTAKIRLPRSSVNFLRQFLPAVQELDGDVALDVGVGGTIAKPLLSGSGDMTVNVARMADATLPAMQNFKARLNFANDSLTLEKFGGELSGGHFTIAGRMTFPKLTTPNLDFQIKADSALIARNDTLTARADADVKIVGPFNSANVTGTIAMTNSQFLKNLDLIPIGLPGRPAPQPPSSRPDFSIPQPPFRDWKFDVTIKTKDPFLIRGNLANGGATSEIHLTGNGLHPLLEGWVRLDNVEATLPFSRLQISAGFLYFDPSDPLNPKIDLHGTSVIRDYTINIYIYGRSLAPEAIFTSEPPLPQEEIISLLATGTTREELTGNNNVLAGRAAMLLVGQLYRKVFKKGQGTQSSSVFDRLDLDVGTVDPRTGQQQATARFKINDQFVVLGDLGVGGDYRGMLKYLIRFK